jgi:hypothetical protein
VVLGRFGSVVAVLTLAGGDAKRLATRLEGAGHERTQLLLARATGNFKRGNERR